MYLSDDINATVSGVIIEHSFENPVIPLPVPPQPERNWRIQDADDI